MGANLERSPLGQRCVNVNAQLFLEIIALLQVMQIVIISIIKSIYGIRKLIKNPEEFEVRNSPLNHYATLIGKLTYC
jgi:hypothetical protein